MRQRRSNTEIAFEKDRIVPEYIFPLPSLSHTHGRSVRERDALFPGSRSKKEQPFLTLLQSIVYNEPNGRMLSVETSKVLT